MSARWSILAIATVTLTAACSSIPRYLDNETTVAELEKPIIQPVPDVRPDLRRETAMRHYQDFLAESPDNVFVPEALRRLADLQLDAEQDAITAGTPLPSAGVSRAAQLYTELLTRYPDHKYSDTALYQLARAQEQTGDLEPAMETLTLYANRHPEGEQYEEAQFRRAEHLFVRRQYAEAEIAYSAVLDTGQHSSFHTQALYKLGWARFKQNDYEGALLAHLQLLDESIGTHDNSSLPAGLPRADQERIDDTLRATSLSFAYLGDADQISNFFRRHSHRSYEPLLYAKLAALHLAKERFTDTAETYRMFAIEHPHHPEAPLFQSRVIDVFKQAGFGSRVLEEKQAFVEHYQPASGYWEQHDPAQAPEVLEQVQRHLRDIAQHYHAEAQRLDKPDAYSRADHWYRLYLTSFADSEQAPLMNFLYAELLSSAGWHDQAAQQYQRTAYDYGPHDKAAEAGYAALLAYTTHESALQGDALARWHRQGIESSLRFAQQFPEHEQALPVRTRAAQQLYALQEYTTAIATARLITEDSSAAASLQLSAWTVLAHAQFDTGDFERAESAYQQVLARYPDEDEGRAKMQEKLAASVYKQGEQARDNGDMVTAAEHFLRVAKVFPASAINVTAQYDAAVAYISLDQWSTAIGILEAWRNSYPQHALQADVTKKLAVLYQENEQPLQAAAEFTRIAASNPDAALRREAAWTAAILYQQGGDDTRSVDAYRNFIEHFPQPLEPAMEARHQLVTLYEKAGNRAQQRAWQQSIIDADRAAGAERSDRTRFLAAHARLALVSDVLDAYGQVQLKEPLKQNLARKKQHMQAAIEGLNLAASYDIASVTTQATYQIGSLYADFGKSLMASERPGKLSAEELEQYEILLEEQAYPFEEKAIEIHEANARRISDGVYDSWIHKSMASLAELLPARYAKEEQSEKFIATLQ